MFIGMPLSILQVNEYIGNVAPCHYKGPGASQGQFVNAAHEVLALYGFGWEIIGFYCHIGAACRQTS